MLKSIKSYNVLLTRQQYKFIKIGADEIYDKDETYRSYNLNFMKSYNTVIKCMHDEWQICPFFNSRKDFHEHNIKAHHLEKPFFC